MRKKWVKQLCGTVGFVSVFLVCLTLFSVVSPYILREYAGPSTEQQINKQFEDVATQVYSCLVLGNSRLYRGLDPEQLSTPTYNFAHDNDAYNQIYWKLKYLEEHDIDFDTAIIGTDYFMYGFLSDTRNEFYKDYLSQEYMKDFADNTTQENPGNSKKWHEQMDSDFNDYIVSKYQYPFNNLLPCLKSLVFGGDSKTYLKDNGQFIVPNVKATDADAVERDMTRLGIQTEYFEKTLAFCKSKGIRVVVVMPPTRDAELVNYSAEQLSEFNQYLEELTKKYNAELLNYAFDENFKATDLYMDITHLTPEAAVLWTEQLNSDLQNMGFFDN